MICVQERFRSARLATGNSGEKRARAFWERAGVIVASWLLVHPSLNPDSAERVKIGSRKGRASHGRSNGTAGSLEAG
jgi:hypothetical protein